MRDLYSSVKLAVALAPVAVAATTNAAAVNLVDVRSVAMLVSVGAITGAAAFGVKLQHSLDGVTYADVPADRVQSDAPAVLVAGSNYRLGYLGNLPFIRATLTLASGTSAIIGVVVLSVPMLRPVY
ncbi:MAG: hypothetical protein A3D16_09965 [Rhodobacterales bacterium RIFCSPHIGHO2_02_FULL_62_130]|nr:MAG: hypothetical protein A3D16_09965 [Rhodobacterales bacterium RIFCSPHIGHO2_02_FULL_62_130]OHC56337.1 MAG: hypothetical protein A3E48_20890 [Rhodobacterales bacterium RIFCSPHIGHO2_12_FULL_62_75]